MTESLSMAQPGDDSALVDDLVSHSGPGVVRATPLRVRARHGLRSDSHGRGVIPSWHDHLPGRSREAAQLEYWLRGADGGLGATVILGGPVASGRTALLRAFHRYAERSGAAVARATAAEQERYRSFGVVRQLAASAPLSPVQSARAGQLIDEVAQPLCASDTQWMTSVTGRARDELAALLIAPSVDTPLVLSVDDAQDADDGSLEFLVFLARRLESARVLLLVAERDHGPRCRLLAELAHPGRSSRVRLGALGEPEVAQVLARAFGHAEVGRSLAGETLSLTGGSPLLVVAVAEDTAAELTWSDGRYCADGTELAVRTGAAFGHAVSACLSRLDALARATADSLAVAGPTSVDVLGRLLQRPPDAVARVLAALSETGLVSISGPERAVRLRHPQIQSAVLARIPARTRASLHRRAAQALDSQGAGPLAVAEHLLAAGGTQEPWETDILVRAAQEAVGQGRGPSAVELLEFAVRGCVDEGRSGDLRISLIDLEWLVSPAAAARHVPWLADSVVNGRLPVPTLLATMRHLAWYGRRDELNVALTALEAVELGFEADVPARTAFAWLAYWAPDLRGRLAPLAARTSWLPVMPTRLEGLDVLASLFAGRDTGPLVARAESILRFQDLDETTVESLTSALAVLLYSDQAALARPRVTELAERLSAGQPPMVHALAAALQAEIALRNGDLVVAAEAAAEALNHVPAAGWGVAVGIPLAAAIEAAVERGRLEDARRFIDIPVPVEMYRTCAGLHYLHACSRYALAVGRPADALRAAQTCGELMGAWGVDLPGVVGWRIDGAWAALAAGSADTARDLIAAQERLLRPGPSRVRGQTLRAHAATLPTAQRPTPLWAAVRELLDASDRLGAAYAFADLADTYGELGQFRRADMAARRASTLAARVGAAGLQARLGPAAALSGAGPSVENEAGLAAPVGTAGRTRAELTRAELTAVDTGPAADPSRGAAGPDLGAAWSRLSDAERKVAGLAARGHTNREIARQLYITVSTVEQHLTKIYRKLGVQRRRDLPV